jgi:hypothetical protein
MFEKHSDQPREPQQHGDWPAHSTGSANVQKKGALCALDRILPAYDETGAE